MHAALLSLWLAASDLPSRSACWASGLRYVALRSGVPRGLPLESGFAPALWLCWTCVNALFAVCSRLMRFPCLLALSGSTGNHVKRRAMMALSWNALRVFVTNSDSVMVPGFKGLNSTACFMTSVTRSGLGAGTPGAIFTVPKRTPYRNSAKQTKSINMDLINASLRLQTTLLNAGNHSAA